MSAGAIGAGIGAASGILQSLFGPSEEEKASNSFNKSGLSFLSAGGGVNNAQRILSNKLQNAKMSQRGFSRIGTVRNADGSVSQSPEAIASEGGGPGGQFGVTQGIDEFRDENQGDFNEKSTLDKILGGLSSVFGPQRQ